MPGEAWKREGSLGSGGVLASRNRNHNSRDSQTFLPVSVQWACTARRAHALVDSGAAGNLMDAGLAQRWSIPLLSLSEPVPVMGLDGQPLGSGFIPRRTVPVRVRVAGGLREDIPFFIVDSPECPLFLGHPWSTGRLILEGGSAPFLFRSPPTTHQPKPPSQTTYQSSPLPQVPHSEPPTALGGRTAATDSITGPDLAGLPRDYWDLGEDSANASGSCCSVLVPSVNPQCGVSSMVEGGATLLMSPGDLTFPAESGTLTYAEKRISIYPELSAELLKQREMYNEVRSQLRKQNL
ncbi:hypothetical protein J4Q44_G00104090 [Coregonus suidteri]|uniref:Uncharacterized protein n=1 Tax=Coregonus suidteri TaxID=861788 RepID=A0AAN8LV11_9TELE